LVTTPERLRTLDADAGDLKSVEHVVLVGADTASIDTTGIDTAAIDAGMVGWDDLGSDNGSAPGEPAWAGIDHDMAGILYTSGSTGLPKGVVLSHRNVSVGAESVSTYLENDADDVILAALPLSFDAGLSQVTTAFAVGAHLVLMNYL